MPRSYRKAVPDNEPKPEPEGARGRNRRIDEGDGEPSAEGHSVRGKLRRVADDDKPGPDETARVKF